MHRSSLACILAILLQRKQQTNERHGTLHMSCRVTAPCSEQKLRDFRTHYLTNELSYVSTQQSGYFPIDTEMKEMCQFGLIFDYSHMKVHSFK
jgi:hypothetical protein